MTMALNSSWMSEKAGCRSLVKEEPKTGWRIDFFALPDRNDIVENLLENWWSPKWALDIYRKLGLERPHLDDVVPSTDRAPVRSHVRDAL